ncbi:elongation factor G [Streptomyces albus]|uniref:elongation factor G n=1 Tax=Streptomyces sp. PHES57 TaxID=2872626 RepID=UPI001CEDF928|nr:TetM/TetW/TetO/TetS family tetracycline resistance ribosomal protection protein [Streptomyces sp. PHES57]
MPAPREGRRTAPARTPHAPAASREDRRPGGAPDNSTRTSSTGTTRNIGIVAHVDAGKTSLTERLLYDTGAIDTLGSVDAGTTRTDSDALERRRGITVRSAVASFTARGTRVNLIDTPGHADFVAEVERALEVLDGAVLVLSAVEGVQPQTRVLMRTLRQMRLPTLLFVNKIDRPGARPGELVAEIRRKLAPHAVPLSRVQAAGSSGARALPLRPQDDAADGAEIAEALADVDDALLARVVDGPPLSPDELRTALAGHTARGTVQPLYFGSALTGEGIERLVAGITELLPGTPDGAAGGAPHGRVFALEREPSGGRTAYVRMFTGQLEPRRRVTYHRRSAEGTRQEHTGRISSLQVAGDPAPRAQRLVAGEIGRVRGLTGIRVGDTVGAPGDDAPGPAGVRLATPVLQSVVRPAQPGPDATARLHTALTLMAEEDPLLHARAEPDGATSVLLHGEVQKEIIAATLAERYGIEAVFEPSRVVCRERPVGVGEAADGIGAGGRYTPAASGHWATVGLRVEPGPHGSGVVFRYETELGALPYAFHRAVEETVHEALRTGPHGWAVTDCVVTLIRSGFAGPVSTAADFRGLTRLLVARALDRAGTCVYEPYHAFELEIPLAALHRVTGALAPLGGTVTDTVTAGAVCTLTGALPARHVPRVRQMLPGLTRGEALWWSRPAGERPASPGASEHP